MPKRIVIVGGGLGGVTAAKQLLLIKPEADITLISDQDSIYYPPDSYHWLAGQSPPATTLLTEVFAEAPVKVVIDPVVGLYPSRSQVLTQSSTAHAYDALILAVGRTTTFFNLPGMKRWAFGVARLTEAEQLQQHLQSWLAKPAVHAIQIVGGGPKGVETAAALAQLNQRRQRGPVFSLELVEASSRILPYWPEKLAEKALLRLEQLGVAVTCQRWVTKEEIQAQIELANGAKSVIWTAGQRLSDLVLQTPEFKFVDGQLALDQTLQLAGWPIWAVGQGRIDPGYYCFNVIQAQAALAAVNAAGYLVGQLSRSYQPPSLQLSLYLGPGNGLVQHGSMLANGRLAAHWQQRQAKRIKQILGIDERSKIKTLRSRKA